ncbi:MAG: RnfABCDGE type electron transport complex subunit G [Lachnospiraceae bacterium]|nr:RnfABCDGE type electron transport complex subunit G [Lachnospiraceae bacterium]
MNKDYVAAAKDALVLIIITLIAGLCLGGVYELTKEPIAHQKEVAVTESCKAVFPDEEGFTPVTNFVLSETTVSEGLALQLKQNGVTVGNIYTAMAADGTVAGYAIEMTSAEGYGGDIRIMCGITSEGVLRGISILEIGETAGLGMRAESVIVPQIHNLDVSEITFTKTGKTSPDEIDAISGATITTRAFVNMINGALEVCNEINPVKGDA